MISDESFWIILFVLFFVFLFIRLSLIYSKIEISVRGAGEVFIDFFMRRKTQKELVDWLISNGCPERYIKRFFRWVSIGYIIGAILFLVVVLIRTLGSDVG